MAISLTCSDCGKRLKARDELAGKLLPCPHCGHKVLVPEADENIAGYLLRDDAPPPSEPTPSIPSSASEEEDQIVERRKPPQAATKAQKAAPKTLPPLTTNEPPLWLRHLHWLLVLALLPLAFSLLNRGDREDFEQRFDKTLEAAPEEVQLKIVHLQENDNQESLTLDELFALLPEHKLIGAWLPRGSFAHWGFAAGSALLFMTFFLLLAAQKTANPLHLLGMGLFTATIGILLLLLLQVLADWSQGIWLRGGNIVVVIFYIVKLIGFSYRAALDPSNGFFLSFVGYTLGVGFCEEVCKALPLLWHYHNHGSIQVGALPFCGASLPAQDSASPKASCTPAVTTTASAVPICMWSASSLASHFMRCGPARSPSRSTRNRVCSKVWKAGTSTFRACI